MNKKEKRMALKSALTSRVQENKLIVLDELKFDAIKTKSMKAVLDNLNVTKALVVLNDNDKNVVLSARNLANVATAQTSTINVYDLSLIHISFIGLFTNFSLLSTKPT